MGIEYFSKLLESSTEKELLLSKKSNNISTARLISFDSDSRVCYWILQ